MRRVLSAALVVLSACGHKSSPNPGKPAGEACATRSECQAALVCYQGVCVASPPAAASCATPPGTATVSAGDAPGPATDPGVCVSTVQGSVLPPEMVQDLGPHQVGTEASFTVPAGTSSFVLFSQEVGNSAPDSFLVGRTPLPNTVVPTNIISPGGALYYDDLANWPTVTLGGKQYPDTSGLLAYQLGFQPISGSFPLPSTSAAIDRILTDGEVAPGTWTFTTNDWARECTLIGGCTGGSTSSIYQVHAITRPGPVASTGTLDVEVYLATDPSSVLSTASGAAVDPQALRWVQSLGHFLANAGLCLGEVTFHDLPSWAKDRYAPNGSVDITDGGPCGDLSQLFTTATIPRRAVHLFLADEIVDQTASGPIFTIGVDGSIPGPSGFPGTISGGAIVGLFDELGFGTCTGDTSIANCGTDLLAYVAAHEIGHWLGLYHPTEQFGTLFDPVADTDRCPCYSCAPAAQRNKCAEVSSSPTTLVTNDVCTVSTSCGGGRNLMFWLLDENVSTGELSRDQGQIVRLNPAVR